MGRALALLLAISVAGCVRAGTPTDPDGIDNSGAFAIDGNRGIIHATIQGLPAFVGTVPTGQAALTPASDSVPAFFIVQALDTDDGTSVLVSGPVTLGSTTASLSTIPDAIVAITLTTRSHDAVTGVWTAHATAGTATVTVSSSSASGIVGTFTATVEATPGSGAAGTRTINGSFSATYG